MPIEDFWRALGKRKIRSIRVVEKIREPETDQKTFLRTDTAIFGCFQVLSIKIHKFMPIKDFEEP